MNQASGDAVAPAVGSRGSADVRRSDSTWTHSICSSPIITSHLQPKDLVHTDGVSPPRELTKTML